jgi:hypothetical protein
MQAHPSHLSDGMHGQLGHTDVYGAHPQPSSQDGADGAATSHVGAHRKLSSGHAGTTTHLPAASVRLKYCESVQGAGLGGGNSMHSSAASCCIHLSVQLACSSS